MELTSPLLTISALLPKTCARRVSAFRGARGRRKTREVARMPLRREPLRTVIFEQVAVSGTKMFLEGNVPSTT